MKYNVDYFIKKFSHIPESEWSINEKDSVLGHCGVIGEDFPEEAVALVGIMSFGVRDPFAATLIPIMINDGEDWAKNLGSTPKQRVLTVLSFIKSKGKF